MSILLLKAFLYYWVISLPSGCQFVSYMVQIRIKKWAAILLGLLLCCLAGACHRTPLPPAAKPQKALIRHHIWQADSLLLAVVNTLHCPVTVQLRGVAGHDTSRLLAATDSQVIARIPLAGQDSSSLTERLKLFYNWGNPQAVTVDSSSVYHWPFLKGKRYEIMQAYEGSFSHQQAFSKYAIDYDMPVGDTVCAMRQGVVVGIVDGNIIGGNHKRYRPYANYITLYHPDGVLSQYVHLQAGSIMVGLGDSVLAGHPLGRSGETGWRSAPHLHANVLRPVQGGAQSIPVRFAEMKGSSIRKGQWVSH